MGEHRVAGIRKAIASVLLGGLLTVLSAVPVLAGMEFAPSSVTKGVLLVASPSLKDPNFRQAVVLIVEHGPEGTLGLILNRSTKVLLSEALPDITVLKGTSYRLFAGGPVQHPGFFYCSDSRSLRQTHDRFSTGSISGAHQRLWNASLRRPSRPKPSGPLPDMPGGVRGSWKMRCSWGRGRSCRQIRGIFEQDPATLWQDCISRLQKPRVISY